MSDRKRETHRRDAESAETIAHHETGVMLPKADRLAARAVHPPVGATLGTILH